LKSVSLVCSSTAFQRIDFIDDRRYLLSFKDLRWYSP
jgi:hypothetical protein